MSHWQIIKCDRCNDKVECEEGKAPPKLHIQGMIYDLCPDCFRAHRAFMAGMSLAEPWYARNVQNQLELIATLQREQERERSKTPIEGGK